jgi:hypothetical protein
MIDLGLSLTCQDVYDYLVNNLDDCQTKNELTRYPPKLSGNYRRSWALVNKCLAELVERGMVVPDEKCVNYAECFRASGQNNLLEELCPTDIADVSSESNTRSTNLYFPRLERSSDLFTWKSSSNWPSKPPIHLRALDAPV